MSHDKEHRGHVRMAYRLAAAYAGRLMWVHGLGWHWYDGRRWSEDDRGHAKRAVIDVVRAVWAELAPTGDDDPFTKEFRRDVIKCQSASGVDGVLSVAAALETFAHTVDDLDADPWKLNTHSGTLDLRTLTLAPHDPADRITKVSAGGYDPEADAGRWGAFLARVLPDDDVRDFLQRIAGVALLGEVREHVLPILTGTGANGKGVFYGAVVHALGDYAVIPEAELFMAKDHAVHSTGLLDLRGRRLAVVSESDEGRRLAEATMKRLTGGDPITARRMHRDNVTFTPSHTPLLVTNHLPKVRGDDPALWRRLRVVPFDVTIPEDERDSALPRRLEDDADAVLSWAVAGLRDYMDRGRLDEPKAVVARTDAYRLASDTVARFIEECCYVSPHAHVAAGDLFERWCKWAAEDGADPMSSRTFGQELDRRGYSAARTNGRRLRRGLGLLSDDTESEDQ